MITTLPPDVEEALGELLERETMELAQFIDLLEAELDALAAGSALVVQDGAVRKQALLNRIFATRDSVNAIARRTAKDPHLKSAESWLARSSSMRIRRAFDDLTDHAERARELNQLAGRLIRIKLSSVNKRLDVLQPAGRLHPVYRPEGLAAGQMSSKGIIGRA
jgi:flagellar biosynthesis/type III secretory pathway chaperone